MRNKGTLQNKPSTGMAALKVVIPRTLDRDLEIRVAELSTTKRAFVEQALRRALKDAA